VAIDVRAHEPVLLLDANPAAPAAAREAALEFASGRLAPSRLEDLQLLVSEVVTNAVRHSGADEPIRLALTSKDAYVCVRVTDGGAGLVPRPGAMGASEGAGVGLFIVEQLARRWGMTREGGKTRVWFELDYDAGPDPG
jgi:anti-sigma regulatory factor (Ser/Thr protein kinase)